MNKKNHLTVKKPLITHSLTLRILLGIIGVILLQGCMPRSVIVHDGLETQIVDSVTQAPIQGAFVYDRLVDAAPRILALSDPGGALLLQPSRKLKLTPLLGEALVFNALWVCKEGYQPYQVGSASGWNADYRPSRRYTPAVIALTRSALAPAESCLAIGPQPLD